MRRLFSALLLFVLALHIGYVGKASCSEDNLSEVFRVLKENGLSDVAACAIVGNAAAESGGSPHCVESGERGRGIGVFQQSLNANRQALEDYCSRPEHDNHPKVTLSPAKADKSYVVCDVVECQVLATLQEFASTMNGRSWSKNYNMQVSELSILAQAVSDGVIPGVANIVNSWEGFKQQDDLFSATVQFQCDYETPGSTNCMWVGIRGYSDSADAQYSFISSISLRYEEAVKAYERFVGPLSSVADDVIEPVETVLLPSKHSIDHTLVMESRKLPVSHKAVVNTIESKSKATIGTPPVYIILLAFLSLVYLAWRFGALSRFFGVPELRNSQAVASFNRLATVWAIVGVFGYILIIAGA